MLLSELPEPPQTGSSPLKRLEQILDGVVELAIATMIWAARVIRHDGSVKTGARRSEG